MRQPTRRHRQVSGLHSHFAYSLRARALAGPGPRGRRRASLRRGADGAPRPTSASLLQGRRGPAAWRRSCPSGTRIPSTRPQTSRFHGDDYEGASVLVTGARGGIGNGDRAPVRGARRETRRDSCTPGNDKRPRKAARSFAPRARKSAFLLRGNGRLRARGRIAAGSGRSTWCVHNAATA